MTSAWNHLLPIGSICDIHIQYVDNDIYRYTEIIMYLYMCVFS